MKNYKSVDKGVNKNSNKASNEETVHVYIPRRCDQKCYKCRYQGICIIPRMIEARKRSIINNILGMPVLNSKYKPNDFLIILGYKKRLLRYLANLKKRKLYSKESE